jgi:hypothetical protein
LNYVSAALDEVCAALETAQSAAATATARVRIQQQPQIENKDQ